MPIGLGEPCFDKLEAKLAHAMLSLPATKAFETGSGFDGAKLRGSAHNDAFVPQGSGTDGVTKLATKTNNAGWTLGGISNGENLFFRVAVKPVSTIGQAQETATYGGAATVLEAKGRHDPCVLPRTPPLVEAMATLAVMDAALIQKTRENQVRLTGPCSLLLLAVLSLLLTESFSHGTNDTEAERCVWLDRARSTRPTACSPLALPAATAVRLLLLFFC
eukprot:COSAG04_NODE_11127_length_729_cov_0.906349_1_plen_218_part_10